jgi:hypothetical protein
MTTPETVDVATDHPSQPITTDAAQRQEPPSKMAEKSLMQQNPVNLVEGVNEIAQGALTEFIFFPKLPPE